MIDRAKNRHSAFGLGVHQAKKVRRNRMALDSVAFRPRVLRDVSEVSMATTVLGHRLPVPLLVALYRWCVPSTIEPGAPEPAAVMATSPSTRTTQPSSARSTSWSGRRATGPR